MMSTLTILRTTREHYASFETWDDEDAPGTGLDAVKRDVCLTIELLEHVDPQPRVTIIFHPAA